eukprot:CAMPEP_0194078548 /NCGR_PEP_ID=MMETSP0149-20130528/4914_1 /TAXON_ID=122233 /ORGANISM="Chaetoceros debilis, Strain MM31A-1" /LENGTH=63 /DNA_ID=CAMNT_0038759829 /DNA_START=44 /DNA_END=232 /DNA_ORIENTATION=-
MKLLTISLLTTALLSVSPAFAQNEGTGKVRRLRNTKGAKAPKSPKSPKSPPKGPENEQDLQLP